MENPYKSTKSIENWKKKGIGCGMLEVKRVSMPELLIEKGNNVEINCLMMEVGCGKLEA